MKYQLDFKFYEISYIIYIYLIITFNPTIELIKFIFYKKLVSKPQDCSASGRWRCGTLREANESADKLAKIGTAKNDRLQVLHDPLVALCLSLRAEAMRVPQLRD